MSIQLTRKPILGEAKPLFRRSSLVYNGLGSLIFLLVACTLLFSQPTQISARRLLTSVRQPRKPNLYNAPGLVEVTESTTKFIPLSGDEPIDYIQLLKGVENRSQVDEIPDLDWIKDKFVLFVGDSRDRGGTRDICEHLGLEVVCVGIDKNWEPAECKRDLRCDIPQLNTTIINVMTFGIVEDDNNFWQYAASNEDIRTGFGKIEQVKNATAAINRHPDMIIYQSAMWDISSWEVRDILGYTTPSASLYRERVKDYCQRMQRAVDMLLSAFPRTALLLNVSPAIRETTELYWQRYGLYADGTVKSYQRTYGSNALLLQLNSIMASIADSRGLDVLPYGTLLTGQWKHWANDDPVHPGSLLNYLYGNLLFSFLTDHMQTR